ncbi:MAG: glycine cleavage system protein H [Planctomycetia bacterium TMED53]|nr:MAG: glycine cleavage system protein H [Planctomycetia bacterium TMED53]
MSEVPVDRFYLSSHEWAQESDDGIVTIGITEFAASELGELVYIELPNEGDDVHFEKQFGEIESVKAVSALNSPISGQVVEANATLLESQEPITDSPFEDGWMLKIQPSDDSWKSQLMNSQDYESQLNNS